MEPTAEKYRLEKIGEIQQVIKEERDKSAVYCKRYNRCIKVVNVVDDALILTAMGLGVAGISILSTIMAPSIVIILESVALGAGGIRIARRHINKKLTLQAEKHQKIRALAETKLNTISGYISKALEDDYISDQEFSLILSELEKFNSMKKEVKSKFKVRVEEETQSREKAVKSFRKKCKRKT